MKEYIRDYIITQDFQTCPSIVLMKSKTKTKRLHLQQGNLGKYALQNCFDSVSKVTHAQWPAFMRKL